MYEDPRNIRNTVLRIRVNAYENDDIELITNLCGGQKLKVAYDIFKLGVQEWHRQNSIGRQPPQQGFFEGLKGR